MNLRRAARSSTNGHSIAMATVLHELISIGQNRSQPRETAVSTLPAALRIDRGCGQDRLLKYTQGHTLCLMIPMALH